ncbi:MAG TPA: hypothetical protein VGR26_09565 [Acidimicrobiales bacterium]|nr:hypothetical protein [Acidimicrobiales bacterium]
MSSFDRRTVRRYVDAALGPGQGGDGGEEQLSDVFIGLVVEAVHPHPQRTDGHGEAWRRLQLNHYQIAAWVKDDLTPVKIQELLAPRGVEVPCRTVQRYVAEVLGRTRGRGSTVRVNDGGPGEDLQVDFGRMGLVFDPATVVHGPGRARRGRHGVRQRLEHEAINVGLIGRMLERGTENTTVRLPMPGVVVAGRFARDPQHFAVAQSADLAEGPR